MKITQITHPEYDKRIASWGKFRDVLTGGQYFVDKYLKAYSKREDTAQFNERRDMSYNPAHAESAMLEIKNSLYQRMVDVTREKGPQSYRDVIDGKNLGVDRLGSSMTRFIGDEVLLELLALGKVGVFVDKDPMPENPSKLDDKSSRPYLYMYRAEDIRSWRYESNILQSVLLREYVEVIDTDTQTVTGTEVQYRLLKLDKGKVALTVYDKTGNIILNKTRTLELKSIPFVMSNMTHSLLKSIDGYQVALLNLASSDLSYCLNSNFTFYTEQIDATTMMQMMMAKQAIDTDDQDKDGSEDAAELAATREIETGAVKGRMYATGLDRPGFISPPTDPVTASMAKQKKLETEIRQIVHLNVANLESTKESAQSKGFNERTLEAGLSYIGIELEHLERGVLEIWSLYEGVSNDSMVAYPQDYSLRSKDQRLDESEKRRKMMISIPSLTYQKAQAKIIVDLDLRDKVTKEQMATITKEIDESGIVIVDPEILQDDVEREIVSRGYAAKLRGYPEADRAVVVEEAAEKASRIMKSQGDGDGDGDDTSANTKKILGADEDAVKLEREKSRDLSLRTSADKRVRS